MNVNRSPITPVTIIGGKAFFISFLTPEGEVYVEAPVKFMARNEESAGNNSICPIAKSLFPDENFFDLHIMAKVIPIPVSQPFNANALPGIYGSNNGVNTEPEHTAPQ